MSDPYKNNVVLYLPMEGCRHGDTNILDLTGKTVTSNGDVVLSNTVAPPFGTTSAYFDGTGDYLSLTDHENFALGTEDFTIEFWMKSPGNGSWDQVMGQRASTGYVNSDMPFGITRDNLTGKIMFSRIYGTDLIENIYSTSVVFDDTWRHIAICRTRWGILLFVNGVLENSSALSTSFSFYNSTTQFSIARSGEYNGQYYKGYIKDLRITKGVARYTGNFSVSQITTVPDEYWGNVVLGIHGEGTGTTFTDVSNSANTITNNGNTTHSTSVAPPFGTSSIYFDGDGDYISVADSADWTFGNSNFTIEFWFRFASTPGTDQYFLNQRVDGGNYICLIHSSTGVIFDSYSSSIQGPKITASVVPDTAWHHLAVARYGSTWTVYYDGSSIGTATSTGSLPDLTAALDIGRWSGVGYYFNGYIKDFRITKGVARYTQNFTPKYTQFPDKSSVKTIASPYDWDSIEKPKVLI